MKTTKPKNKPSRTAFTFRDLPDISLLRMFFIFCCHVKGDHRQKARTLGIALDQFEQLKDCYHRRLKRMAFRTSISVSLR